MPCRPACAAPPAAQQHSVIQPEFSKATLSANGKELLPRRVRERWPTEILCGDSLVRINEAKVECIENATDKLRWRSNTKDGAPISLLGEHDGLLLLLASKEDENGHKRSHAVERIRLRDGEWLSPLKIPLGDAELKANSQVQSILGDVDGVLVLSMTTKVELGSEPKPVSYRLTKFGAKGADVVWSKLYPSGGLAPSPGAFIIGTRGPSLSNADIQRLTHLGSNVLVAAGPKEDLLLVQPSDGKTVWGVPRLWEYRRGFIGPSVWSYFLGRFGFEDHVVETASLTLEQYRDRNKKYGLTSDQEQYFKALKQKVGAARGRIESERGWIVAGPVALSVPGEFRNEFRIFVAVARSESDEFPDYLSECIIYELNGKGKVIGTVPLPRFVQGAHYNILGHSVVWLCDHYSLARLQTSPDEETPDLIIDLDWHTDRPKERPKFWMQSGQWTISTVFAGDRLLEVREGGYVEDRSAKTVRLPIRVLDLKTHNDAELAVNIPFQGKIPIPPTNYSHDWGPHGDRWTLFGSFPIEISRLEIRGQNLLIGVELQSSDSDSDSKPGSNSLEFDLANVVPAAAAQQSPAGNGKAAAPPKTGRP